MLTLMPLLSFASEVNTINLTGSNTVVFDLQIDAVSADNFLSSIVSKRAFLDEKQPLYLVIISGGGNYSEAVAMRAIIKQIPNLVVICKYCGSAAGYLFATSPKRYAIDKSIMMMHEMFIIKVTAKQIVDPATVKGLLISSFNFDKTIYSVIGISREEYESHITNKEWEVRGKDLVRLHLADKLVKVTCDTYMSNLIHDTCSE